MPDFVYRLAPLVKYGFIGFFGGLLFFLIFSATNSQSEIPWISIAGITFGAAIGGHILQRLNTSDDTGSSRDN